MTETVRETATVQADGRVTIPDAIRKAVNIYQAKAFVQAEAYGKNKILLTVLTKWEPPKTKSPYRDVAKKEPKTRN